MADESVVGSIVSLWRYPVKSMMGEELNATEVTESGLLGDRAYALVDAETGKIISAKLPRKWSVLFDCSAALNPPSQVRETPPFGFDSLLMPGNPSTATVSPCNDGALSDDFVKSSTMAVISAYMPTSCRAGQFDAAMR